MGSSASTRSKSKTSTAAASKSDASCDQRDATNNATSDTASASLTTVGGDTAVDDCPSATRTSNQNSESATEMAEHRRPKDAEDSESSSSEDEEEEGEDGGGAKEAGKTGGPASDLGHVGGDDRRPEKTTTDDTPTVRDVACQSGCTSDEPDAPMDAPPPSPQHVHSAPGPLGPVQLPSLVDALDPPRQQHPSEGVSQTKGRVFFPNLSGAEGGIAPIGDVRMNAPVFHAQQPDIVPTLAPLTAKDHGHGAGSFPSGTDLMDPYEGAVPAGLEGGPPRGDQKPAVVPDNLPKDQQLRPAADGGSFPGAVFKNIMIFSIYGVGQKSEVANFLENVTVKYFKNRPVFDEILCRVFESHIFDILRYFQNCSSV